MSWREEMREDRRMTAEQRRADQDAAAARRRADLAAQAEQARLDEGRRRAERERQAADRRERLARVAAWCGEHVQELLFVPVILVPALLAWTAMSDYGATLYGTVGRLLPVFSEGAMWVFAAATTLTRRRHPERPTGMLQAGTWTFAAVAGVLNFAHGLSVHGIDAGIVMALVSIAGVAAHQLITAGPVRSRAQRAEDRIARQADRRVLAVRRAAVRHAVADLAADGTARLVYRPGTVTLSRPWFGIGHTRLATIAVPGREPAPVTGGGTVGAELADEITDWLAAQPETPLGTAQTLSEAVTAGTSDARFRDALIKVQAAITAGRLPEAPSRREVQRFLKCRTKLAGAVAQALKHDDGGSALAAA